MANQEAKFDTMELIADAAATDDFSVEDIVEEFSEPAESPQQVEAVELEVPERLTKAQLADAIAAAIAASMPQTEEEPETEPLLEPELQPEQPEQAEVPEPPAEPEGEAESDPEQPEPEPEAAPRASAQQQAAEPPVHTEPVPDRAGQKQQAQDLGQAPKKPQKIARQTRVKSRGMSEFADSLGLMIGGLRARQRAFLPPAKASLKTAEQRKNWLARIGSVFSPVRYLVLLLMALSLAGRRFSWMLLGFLGGETGVTVAVVFTLLAMAASWQSLVRAVKDAILLRFSYEMLLLVTTVLSLVETAVFRNQATLLPLLAMGWCVSGTAAQMSVRAELRSLRTVIRGQSRTAVRTASRRYEQMDCIGKAPASTTGFVRHLEEPDTWHSGWSAGTILIFLTAVLVSGYVAGKTDTNYLSVLVVLLTVATPVSLSLCCARPYELLSRILNGAAAMAGWFGVKNLSGRKAMLIYDGDVFPKGTITHRGVKVYGKQTPRLLVSYAASLILRADNGLRDVFTQLLREVDGEICDVSHFQMTEGGLTGYIRGVRVMVGSAQFMQLMGAMLPAGGPKNGTYIALNEELAGVIAIQYRVKPRAAMGFHRVVRDPGLTVLIAAKNFCINPSFLERWFQTPVSGITCPKLETRRSLSAPAQFARGPICGYVLKDGISGYSRLVAGGRGVYRMGLVFTAGAVALSLFLLIRTAMALAGGGAAPGGAQLLLYQLLLFLAVEIGARISVR